MSSSNEAPPPAKTGKKRNKSFKRRLKDVQTVINNLFAKKAEVVKTYKYVLIPPSDWKMVKDCKPAMDKVHLQGRVSNFKYDNKKAFLINSLVNVKGQIITCGKEQWKLEKLDFKATLFLSNLPFLFSKEMALELGNFVGSVDAVNIPNDSSCHIGTGNIVFRELNTKSVLNISELNIGGGKIFCKWSKQTIQNIDSFIKPKEKQSMKNARANTIQETDSDNNIPGKTSEKETSVNSSQNDHFPNPETPDSSNIDKKEELSEGAESKIENNIPNEDNLPMDLDLPDFDEPPSKTDSSPCPATSFADKQKTSDDDARVPKDDENMAPDNRPPIVIVDTNTNFSIDKQGSGRLRGLAELLKNSEQKTPNNKKRGRPENTTKSPEEKKKIKFNDLSDSDDTSSTDEVKQ